MPCDTYIASLPWLPCIDGDWLLLAVRIAPFFLVTLLDTSIFYQLVLTVFGIGRGLLSLDLAIVSSWDQLVREFHRGPLRWWSKVMSGEWGWRGAQLAVAGQQVSSQRRCAPLRVRCNSKCIWMEIFEYNVLGFVSAYG